MTDTKKEIMTCMDCGFREKYTFLCKHPNVKGDCIVRRDCVPSWCPMDKTALVILI